MLVLMKRLWIVPSLVLLLAAGCQAVTPRPPTATPDVPSVQRSPLPPVMGADDAVRAVLASSQFGSRSAIFPKSVGSQMCEIRGGGPPPGRVVPGICRIEVEASGPSSYVVTFVEAWDATRFHLSGEPSSGELHHTWPFVVSSAGVVVAQLPTGNFPPDQAK